MLNAPPSIVLPIIGNFPGVIILLDIIKQAWQGSIIGLPGYVLLWYVRLSESWTSSIIFPVGVWIISKSGLISLPVFWYTLPISLIESLSRTSISSCGYTL